MTEDQRRPAPPGAAPAPALARGSRNPQMRGPRRVRLAWAAALSFAEGAPLGLFVEVLPLVLCAHGASLHAVGGVSSLRAAWSVKVAWSPLVARWGRWRVWVAGCSGAMATALCVAAGNLEDAAAGGAARAAVGAALVAFVIASATQDVAIDGAFARLTRPGEEGPANAWRVAAYRAAMLAVGGGLVAASAHVPWRALLFVAAGLVALPALWVWRAPATADGEGGGGEGWLAGLRAWARAPAALETAAFLALYKFGDATMASMVKPFWLAHGRSAGEIGGVCISLGLGATVAGGLVGGAYLARRPLVRGLWVLGAWQAASNLGYAAVALFGLGRWHLFAASVLESVTQGMGTTALLALVTRLAARQHATLQFALMTALAGVGAAASGVVGGHGAQALGYGLFFLATFFLCLPAALFLPAVGRRLAAAGENAPRAAPSP